MSLFQTKVLIIVREEVGGVSMGVDPYVCLMSLFPTKVLTIVIEEVGGVSMGVDPYVCV